MDVFLSGISYHLGESFPIDSIPELQEKSDILENFLALGLKNYCVSSCSPGVLAKQCISQTLEKAKLNPADIDCFIYATNSFWDNNFYSNDIRQLLCDLKLTKAYPIGVFLSYCGNFHSAISIAHERIVAGRAKNVLLVTADKLSPHESRIYPPNITILSDAVASCIVTAHKGDFKIKNTYQHTNPYLWLSKPSDDLLAYMKATLDGIKAAYDGVMKAEGVTSESISKVITNNYNLSIVRTFTMPARFKTSQIYTANLARFAHAFASDNLINLDTCVKEESIKAGELLLLLGTSPTTWSTTLLESTHSM
jgi:3-oxoacyl-[acyl-carrier-protein] synthase III